MKKHAIKIVPNQINYSLSVHYILPFVGIKEKCHAPYREVLRDEEHCATNKIKLFYHWDKYGLVNAGIKRILPAGC